MKFHLTRTARRELDEIFAYWANRTGIDAAGKVIDSILDRFPLARSFPEAGRSRDELAPGLRSLPAGEYIVYYKKTRSAVSILHVIHGARDQKRAINPPKSS